MIYTNPPKTCDVCKKPVGNSFVDGKTVHGPWANMCYPCHDAIGRGLGIGRGQQYQCNENGQFVKVWQRVKRI